MLNKIENALVVFEKWMMLIATALIVLAVSMQVFFRYVIPVSVPWTEELSIISFIFVVVYGSALAVRYDRHLGIANIVNKLKPKAYIIVWYVKKILVVLFVVQVLIFRAFPIVMQGLSNTYTIIQVQTFFVLVQIPIAAALMVFHLVCSMIRKDYKTELAALGHGG
ncbi:MAG: hypothetical protein CVU43_23940 [Chloroflexi bacterium HGW-Chloroflexi-5]|jgi:TRAP-type C4-dicarboxylate transport system permease small subunit|nr:MAG: hypothetical protein CVU43_23940 [Chloroflexi bacterium HGW-Chloroflexi-5]